jgi:FkbM family methyltransferase
MLKKICKNIYYFFYDIIILFRNLDPKYNFIVITPRLFSKLIKKSIIYDKLNKNIFIQNIRNDYDLITIYEIFSDESYNLKNFKIFKKVNEKLNLYRNNDTKPLILDCGSNIGASSEYFKRIYKSAEIAIIEPDKNNLEFSKKNTSIKEKFIFNKAISSEEKLLKFSNISEDNRAFKVADDGNLEIESINVEKILNILGDYQPFLIKIDIEGFEKNLFEKNYQWIKQFNIIIIELHDWMLPNQHNSNNFINAINEVINNGTKFDFLISGENLILIKNDINKKLK